MWNFTKMLSLSVPQLLHLKKKLIIALAGPPSWLSGKESTCNAGDQGLIPGSGRSSGEGMATHNSILAWKIPQTEELGRLQSMGLKKSQT